MDFEIMWAKGWFLDFSLLMMFLLISSATKLWSSVRHLRLRHDDCEFYLISL